MVVPAGARPVTARPVVRPTWALTVGEPAGIGPEIAIRAAWALREVANCVLVGDAAFLALTASLLDPGIRLAALSTQALRNGGLPQFGFHLVEVLERKSQDMTQQKERLQARQVIRERKVGEAFEDWARQVRDRAYVEFREEA